MLNSLKFSLITLSLVLTTTLLPAPTSYAAQTNNSVHSKPKQTVATVIPVAHSLLVQLLSNTSITVHYLPPKRLPINRLSNWVTTHASKIQPNVNAVIGIDALRPELSFYTALRKENIHTINIDIGQALMPGGEKVAIYQENQHGYFWLNINNALLMTGILRRDLTAIWPEQAKVINDNAAKINQQLRGISMQLDDVLFEKEIEQLVVAQDELADFAASFALPIVTLAQAKNNGLNSLYISKIKAKSAELTSNISIWSIDDFSKTSSKTFTERWLKTVENLAL
ncbi:zinc ABC transporter substrate-binding protein [Colwellia sp. D2M02]|uniref:ABC transporter substrate-binding protein n=1 Tax=Colwellia asteriadis TaxID=517723 RepID=A0ABN1L3V2_9GAMM|nr:zinc ABC transporter substrate-binding protein [Colwellia sp. D2M02]MBU2891830.1 zinc ABC transporter substrate-binding protein [Colwellia sp. D2M02]